MPPRREYPYNVDDGLRTLCRRDRRLGRLIRRVGPYALPLRRSATPFQSLLRAIVSQQLSGYAARAIYGRLAALFPGRRPSARRLSAMSDRTLLETGLSRAKLAAVRDLADKTRNRLVPGTQALAKLEDEEIVTRLTQVRGVGRWTVEMLLIFHLGRADVLAANDLGIRKGLRIAYDLGSLPEPEDVLVLGQKWRPYRSIASWYLWRANDL